MDTGFYLHGNNRSLVTDQNEDDFLDLPLTSQVNLLIDGNIPMPKGVKLF